MIKIDILQNHISVLSYFKFLYKILVLSYNACTRSKNHKTPYKQWYIAGSSKCSTKPISVLLTKILAVVKDNLQQYCATAYSRSGVNQMWILKNSKDLLENLKSQQFSTVHSVKSYDFSALYTTIPHKKLKSRLFDIIDNCFFSKKRSHHFDVGIRA